MSTLTLLLQFTTHKFVCAIIKTVQYGSKDPTERMKIIKLERYLKTKKKYTTKLAFAKIFFRKVETTYRTSL